MKTRIGLFLLALALIMGCKKDPDTTPEGSISTESQALMLSLVNEHRAKGADCGGEYQPPVEPVTWNKELAIAAQLHSEDMYKHDYFSHTAPDGSTPSDRVTRAGYIWTTCGENIAMGYPDEASVIDGWMNSPGHCKNIMRASFKEMGVGVKGTYWTQEFGAR